MRLVGQVDTQQQAFIISNYLTAEGIENSYEADKNGYGIWIENEDDLRRALELLEDFKKDPKDGKFLKDPTSKETTPADGEKKGNWKVKLNIKKPSPFTLTMTNILILLCVFFYLWINIEKAQLAEKEGKVAEDVVLTPVQEKLFFDYTPTMQAFKEFFSTHDLKEYKDPLDIPVDQQKEIAQIQCVPMWHGIYDKIIRPNDPSNVADLFIKIRQGEVWRLFTPVLLHYDFLHILFNMIWLWILGKQIESRLGKTRLLILCLITGILANVAQYLVTGPYFLGFSGIVMGLAGFIWMRQRMAPWEGYPLQKSTFLFLVAFIAAIFALEVVTFFLEYTAVWSMTANIANTAHIVGGLTGIMLARLPFFARKAS